MIYSPIGHSNPVKIFISNTKGEFSNNHACIYNECVQTLSNFNKDTKTQ